MLGWTRYHEQHNDTHTNYDYVRITQELKTACIALQTHVVTNKIKFEERSLIPDNYPEFITEHREEFQCNAPRGMIASWFNERKYQRAMKLPVRSLKMNELPEDLVKNALVALEKQETVFQHAAILRVIKLEPGDQTMLHYDPRTFYTEDRLWHKDYLDKYIDKRAFVYMNDRKPGQISYLGNSEIDYKQFDMVKFDAEKVYHGAANFGYDDRIMICFSWAEPIGQ